MRKTPRSKKTYCSMQREAKKNTQVWAGWVDGDEVITQWGVLDGKIQETVDIPGEKGKKGTKAWISPERSALEQLVRDVKKKAQAGYEIIVKPSKGKFATMLEEELGGVTRSQQISFDGPLPNNVAFSKPVNSIKEEKLRKLESRKSGRSVGGPPLAWTVKKNGMCFVVSKDRDGSVWIQSRGKMKVENDKFPHLVEEFEALLPAETILLCEFYIGEGKTKEEFKAMQQIANSLPERAIEMQRKLGLVHAYVFRMPFWEGDNLEKDHSCSFWLDWLMELVDGWGGHTGLHLCKFVHGPDIAAEPYDDMISEMRKYGYEGWVVYDCWGSLGEKHLSFLGQPDRPNVCWKVKNALEDDFIGIWEPDGMREHCTTKCHVPDHGALQKQTSSGKCAVCGKRLKTNGAYGTGKNMKRVGSISLYQYDKDGVKHYIGEVSGGLTDAQRKRIADEGMWIGVLQVGYQDRSYISKGQDSNALTFPKVLSFRRNKDLNECINEEL